MEATTPTTTFNPRPRWLRYSLRTLLLLITILCIWLGLQVNAARRQHEAVAAILKAGGVVYFEYQLISQPDGTLAKVPKAQEASPNGPRWLREYLGDEYFRKAEWVDVSKRTLSESDFQKLAELPNLKYLEMQGLNIQRNGSERPARLINDTDLASLKSIGSINSLGIDGEIDTVGLHSMRTESGLVHLGLRSTSLTEQGICEIGKMSTLKGLELNSPLNSPLVTDDGLRHLQKLECLEYLGLFNTSITDAGLPSICAFPKLKYLWINNLRILKGVTDAGVKHLCELPNLEHLQLCGTSVTMNGLQELKGCPSLKWLSLDKKVTDAEIAELQKSLPKVRILRTIQPDPVP